MKLSTLSLLAMTAALSSCAEPMWQRMIPPSHMQAEANGCAAYVIDDAAPMSQWKNLGVFWDQDVCQGTPFQVALIKGQKDQSKESVQRKAEAGDQDSIKIAKCWDQKDYLSWTAPASHSLVRHEWDSVPYACVEKGDPRLKETRRIDGSPEVAGK